MNRFYNILRWLVGLLFIFSGLVKAIDPLGLSYKMQEFFEVWGTSWADGAALPLSILMNTFEIGAGLALLLHYQPKLIHRLLLLLIVFFTFLTGYAAFSGRFSSCGCFGECIPLKPTTSFAKDLFLLLAIGFLIWGEKQFAARKRRPWIVYSLGLGVAASLALQMFALQKLPPVDCLPYKKGNDLLQMMKMPEGAVADSFAMMFVYEKDGQELRFPADQLPEDLDDRYVFKSREDKLVREATGRARISDLALLSPAGNDTTQALLQLGQSYTLLLLRDVNERTLKAVQSRGRSLAGNVFLVTNRLAETKAVWPVEKTFILDYTVLKTFARAPLVVAEMQGAVVKKKYVPAY